MEINESNLNVAWSLIDGEGLIRVVPTSSFGEGVAIVARLAEIAEHQGHDPEVLLESDKVTVTLYSQDTQAVTQRDIQFAQAVDAFIA